MITAVIIDDVEMARRTLADDLASVCPDITLIGEASGVRSGLALIERLSPDLIFLDIQLEDGSGFDILEGIDLLEGVNRRDLAVIFTTASDAFGIKAIKFSALDYLLKPIDQDELVAAVKKFATGGSSTKVGDRAEILFESLRRLHGGSRRIALSTAERIHVVATDDIIRCESQRNYTLVHLRTGRPILVTRTLKEFNELLEGSGFFRVHHSHLVNMGAVAEYVKGDGGYIVMIDRSEVPVAVRKKDALLIELGTRLG
jgi:two-component system LytT family response regulator